MAAEPSSALEDVVNRHHLRLTDIDANLFQNRHQGLTKSIERLLRVPDVEHRQLVTGAETGVIRASRRLSGASRLELPDARVVLLSVHRCRRDVDTDCHVQPPSMDGCRWRTGPRFRVARTRRGYTTDLTVHETSL